MRNYTKYIENLLFDFLFGVGFGVGGGCITAGEDGGVGGVGVVELVELLVVYHLVLILMLP